MPAVIFLLFNPSGEDAQAWGVVISTDTAFLVGALAIIKPKFPGRLRIFLLTLAVVDDVGRADRDRGVLLRRIQVVPLAVVGRCCSSRSRWCGSCPPPAGPPTRCWASRCGSRCSWRVSTRRSPVSRVALLIPVFTPERRQVEAGRRGDPGIPAVAELAVRPRRHPPPAPVDFDQRAAADRRRALRLVRGVAAVRVGQRRGSAGRGEPERRGCARR